MLKIIGIVGAVVLVVIAGVLIYATTKPDSFHVERTASIKAPPDVIFAQINDLHRWAAWSPYEKLDPAMKKTFSGAESGVGAVYEWEGNSKAGQGRIEIVESTPSSAVKLKLDFIKPFEAHNMAAFTLVPQGGETAVTWSIDGPCPYISKVMGIFFDMDKLIGKDFETGLADLKRLSEGT